jgi:serine/threonine protein kinase
MKRVITHYEIFEKIGEGGMGVVFKARDLRLDRIVAVKMLPDNKFAGPSLRERFLREARTASSLNHPNIVTIYEVESSEGSHLIVMEYVKGKSLSQILQPRGLPLTKALRYAIQVADGIAKAHSA